MKRNNQNNAHTSETTKNNRKKDEKSEIHSEKRRQPHRRFLDILENARTLRSYVQMSSRGVD